MTKPQPTVPALFLLASFFSLISCTGGDETGPVDPTPTVSAVEITPLAQTVEAGLTVPLTATARDGGGTMIAGQSFTWSSSDTLLATVGASGVLRAVAAGTVTVSAQAGGKTGALTVTIARANPGRTISAGWSHSCALVLAEGQAYCWGSNKWGQLGDGTHTNSAAAVRVRQPAGVQFVALDAGGNNACGLTAAGQAYCWGENWMYGAVGDGTYVDRSSPTLVLQPAGVSFVSILVGLGHVCALTASGQAYCWGRNDSGELGTGKCCASESTPALVAQPPGVAFQSISPGESHTCAVTTSQRAYCWGLHFSGRLGTGTLSGVQRTPVAVQQPGDVAFSSISAGLIGTCALTTTGRLYCWGAGAVAGAGSGALLAPTQAAQPSGVIFESLEVGGYGCALSPAGKAYCWTFAADAPHAVTQLDTGDFAAISVAISGSNACGVARSKAIYCWAIGGVPAPVQGL